MRICINCGIAKSEQDFFYRNRSEGKLHTQCKECYAEKRRKMWKAHYHKYGSKYRERAIERNKRLKAKLRTQLQNYLSDKSCTRCGVNDSRVLEFHHIDSSTKSFSIARAVNNTVSWQKILNEIEKCQILCANCHKIKTADEQGWYKAIAE